MATEPPCPICNLTLTRQNNISRLLPCTHKFHLSCFMTKAQGLPPYNCPACSTQVSSVENEDGTRWQVEVLFPAGTTQREARRYLEEAGVTEDVVTVLIEQGHQEVGAGVWNMLDRKK